LKRYELNGSINPTFFQTILNLLQIDGEVLEDGTVVLGNGNVLRTREFEGFKKLNSLV